MTTMKNKPISFNIDNPNDKYLFEQIKNIKNFSGYAKSLIANDLRYKNKGIKVEVGKNR
ncbi:hypothetical protein [Salinibacillus xinjiangensis]|uniref:Uncharacterized protein n=1 Tax=Salinibacillus xinjiangensis TaxID=1229268 RepID=A0A6G1X7Y9_9BACI|nr:hypothetical protein [Salinibacillus xinjiangensis]MRG87026.1 hypothetical protein [Salinibacillus xinjiangensis]